MKEKALIKKTGEIFDIEERYMKSYVTTSFYFNLNDTDEKEKSETDEFESKHLGNFFKLSNGKEYSEKQLVIGIDDIREFKLKGIV